MSAILGSQFKFTWSGTGTNALVTTRGIVIEVDITKPPINTTPEQTDDVQEFTLGLTGGTIRWRQKIDSDDAQPNIPEDTVGTWVLYPKHSTSGKNWTGSGKIFRVRFHAVTEGRTIEVCDYSLIITDTITRATA